MTNAKVFITARLKSTRLKYKAILPLGNNTLISFLIKRLSLVFKKKNIILITSKNKQDKPLIKIAKNEGIDFFCGHPEDVLLRMNSAAKKYKVKNFLSCTADNPYTDPIFAEKLYKFHIKNKLDMSTITKLPFGTFCYAVNTKALSKVIKIKNTQNTEIWGDYFRKINKFKYNEYKEIPKFFSMPNLRLTVDVKKDYQLIKEIYNLTKKQMPSLEDIIKCVKKNPYLIKINSGVKQKKNTSIKVKKYQNALIKK
jgi:spore coat polysaccharide biosynthesis protein SpsF